MQSGPLEVPLGSQVGRHFQEPPSILRPLDVGRAALMGSRAGLPP